jgi:magnesium transporter
VQEFSLDERLETELLSPTPTSIVASSKNSIFLVLHFPLHDVEEGSHEDQEVDIIVGKTFIITVHYKVVVPLDRLKKILGTEQIIASDEVLTTEILLEILFVHLYTSVRDHITHSADSLGHIERDMFSGLERITVRSISIVSREFLHITASLANQEEPLDRFLKALAARSFFTSSFSERAERVRAERVQIAQLAVTYRMVAVDLRETNMALLESRQNGIMKTLTIVNFIFLPLGLISWIFAMRTEGMPIIDSPYAFWIVLALMLGVTLILTTFFIKKRWF